MRNNANRRQVNVTGRDSYLLLQALAYTIVAISLRPAEYQEWSNAQDMNRLLDYWGGSEKEHFLNNAKRHLTGVDHVPDAARRHVVTPVTA